jgi:zinc-ribbon domain
MSRFCEHCGTALDEGTRFCANCGAPTQASAEAQQAAAPQPTAAAQPAAAAPSKGMSAGAKLAIAAVVIIFVGGAVALAGVFYAAHRVSQKFEQVKSEITGTDSSGRSPESRAAAGSESSTGGDPCRYLSKEEVSRAIGVEIVTMQPAADACSYMAKGTEADMAAKHAAKMMGANGADDKTQKMAEQFGAAIFKTMPQDKQARGSDSNGNVPVFAVSVEASPAAREEMKLNSRFLKNLGGPTGEDLNLGDEAFETSDGMIMIRKGQRIIRITYMLCPCATKDVIPLAQKVAGAV